MEVSRLRFPSIYTTLPLAALSLVFAGPKQARQVTTSEPFVRIAGAPQISIVAVTTPPYDAAAKYRAVHIDLLDPHLQNVFERARIEWLKVLAVHHTTDGRGFFLQRDGTTLLTLRSFDSFTEYDVLRALRADVENRIGPEGKEAVLKYDHGDVAIISPHNSEVWSRNADLDYLAPGNNLNEYTSGFMRMEVEQVRSDDYEAAWKEIHTALATAKYPRSRIVFFSMLGSGRQISLWLAPDRAAFRSAGTPAAAVAAVLGKGKAKVNKLFNSSDRLLAISRYPISYQGLN